MSTSNLLDQKTNAAELRILRLRLPACTQPEQRQSDPNVVANFNRFCVAQRRLRRGRRVRPRGSTSCGRPSCCRPWSTSCTCVARYHCHVQLPVLFVCDCRAMAVRLQNELWDKSFQKCASSDPAVRHVDLDGAAT